MTPAAWNAGVFSMIRNLSDNVVVPIAGMVLTFVMCYELISMIIDRNNLHDFETFVIYKWIVKTFVAVYLVSIPFRLPMMHSLRMPMIHSWIVSRMFSMAYCPRP